MALTITTIDALKKSATQYQKELLIMPVTSAQATLQHMQGMPGLKGNLVLSEIYGEAELAPYKRTNVKDAEIGITARTLEMYLGNCAYNFDPNELWGTIYGSLVTQGEALKGVDINKSILMLATARMGKKLNMAIWNAKRNADGSTTKDLFNGFDTITDSEKLSEGIKADNGNYLQLTEDITEANAIDTFQKIYDAASDELQSQPVKIYCSKDIYSAYNRNYQLLHGALPYNTEFKKTYLEGTDGLWEFCPLASKKGSKYIHIAPQSNMIYGYGAGENPGETLDLGKYAPWALTLEASMAFGVQFKTISQEMLFVAELKAKE